VLSDEWIINYQSQHQLRATHIIDATSKVLNKIISTTGLNRVYTVIWDGNPPVCKALAQAVGHKKRNGEVILTPKERIERVKELLGMHEDLSWYDMC
jgi:hypothetical protein